MKRSHISIITATATVITVILGGENPILAIKACYKARKFTNMLFDMGLSPRDISYILYHNNKPF